MPKKDSKKQDKPEVKDEKATGVQIIITAPKGFRCFDPENSVMLYPKELEERGIFLTPNGRLIATKPEYPVGQLFPLWRTDQADAREEHIYERDILEVEVMIPELGSVVKRVGMMIYDPRTHQFTIGFNGKGMFKGAVQIVKCTVIGNSFEHTEAVERYNADNG